MCIIIAKSKENRLPTKEELQQCFNRNSDGAGFMYVNNNNRVIIDKGYMTFKDFEKRYNKLLKRYNNFDNKSLVIHFRIGTSGTNSAKNTHPYPIENNTDYLHKNYFNTDLGVAHNGIISDYTPLSTNTQDTNDTQEFIKQFLTPMKKNYNNFYKDKNIKKAIKYLTNSKFTFLDTSDNLELVGEFIEDNNLNFSNSTYKKIEYTTHYKNYHYLDDYGYDYDTYNNYNSYKFLNNFKEKDEEETTLFNYNLDILEPSDWVEFKSGNIKQVQNNCYYIDIQNNNLYEEISKDDFVLVGKDVIVYNKDFEEIY